MIVSLRLATNTKLKFLELNGNSLGPAAAEELVKGLASNKTLEKSFGQHESSRGRAIFQHIGNVSKLALISRINQLLIRIPYTYIT